jgi:NAD+--asparagine ADP-ribosyltransferase
MKKVAVTVAVLALGLAACEARTEENAVDNELAVENEAMTDVNAATDDANLAADNALESATNAIDEAGNAVENAGEAVENAAENATE